MKISIDWLKDYVAVDEPYATLVDKLNNLGLKVVDWEERDGDAVFELSTYSNRPDTLGHIGIARELSPVLGKQLKEPELPLVEENKSITDFFDVQVWNEELCPRFCSRIVTGMQVGPAPEWMQRRLRMIGVEPVNNIVDTAHYVLFATGYPIFVYDLAKLRGSKIIVRTAQKDEAVLHLDDKKIELSSDMLVIADEKMPVALAGIKSGKMVKITEKTSAVLLESAYFDPAAIYQTCQKTGLFTDASFRYERGMDITSPPQALRMAASLLAAQGGKPQQGMLDIFSRPRKAKTVILRKHRITEFIGIELEQDFIERVLTGLGFKMELQQPEIWRVQVPSFRLDIEREADLIEELARFYGYEKIPAQLPAMFSSYPITEEKRKLAQGLRRLLFHEGFDEVVNSSFFDPEKEVIFHTELKAVEIQNPLSPKTALMKTTLIGGLLENLAWNWNRGAEGVHIFETGKVFFQKDEDFVEQQTLALATAGIIGSKHWQQQTEKTDYYSLKGSCEALLYYLGFTPVSFTPAEHVFFYSGHSVAIKAKGKQIGILGLLRESILEAYSLKEKVWAAEIDLEALFEMQPQMFHYTPVSKFPSVVRDVTFIADLGITFQEIKTAMAGLSMPNLEKFEFIDRFEGSVIPRGKVSLSLRFTFRDLNKTLQAAAVDNLLKRIIKNLQNTFNFQLREGGEN